MPKLATLNISRGQNIKYLPFAFTELGVAMLSSVLENVIGNQGESRYYAGHS
jgi:hypothetical protein